MSIDLWAAIVGGVVSGAVSGVLTSSLYIRWVHMSSAEAGGPAVVGRGNQTPVASAGSQAASSRRGNINQSITNMNNERRAQLAATIAPAKGIGLPAQILVLRNVGDAPAEELMAGPAPDHGGFVAQPDWSKLPRRLAGGQSIELPCVTRGAGMVTFIAQFHTDGAAVGPILVEAAHA